MRGERLVEPREPFAVGAGDAKLGKIAEPIGRRWLLAQQLERVLDLGAPLEQRIREAERLVGGLTQRGDRILERGRDLRGEDERAACRAQAVENRGEHALEAVGSVGGEQPQPLGLTGVEEARERCGEGLGSQHARLALVQDAEAGIEAGFERMAS